MQTQRYNNISILFHWVVGVLLIVVLILGWYADHLLEEFLAMQDKESETWKAARVQLSWWIGLHKSMGLTVALLALARLLWRFTHRPPPLPDTIEMWKRKFAPVVHYSLYLLMFVQPTAGYLASSFGGHSTEFWGLKIPDWAPESKMLDNIFSEIHEWGGILFAVLIVLHLTGSVVHMVRREWEVLERMLPGRS